MKRILDIKRWVTTGCVALVLGLGLTAPLSAASVQNPTALTIGCQNGKDGNETHGRGKDGNETPGRVFGKDGNETHGLNTETHD